MDSMDAAMSEDVSKNLDSLKIEHQRMGDGRLCVRVSDSRGVARIMNRTVTAMIPANRSISLEQPVHDMVITELGKKGIQYKLRTFSERTYLVWTPEDETVVKMVVEQQEEKYSSIWFEQNK